MSVSSVGAGTGSVSAAALADMVARELPYLRRYARALTGNQSTGDTYALATLEAILSDRSVWNETMTPKTALFRAFNFIWTSSGQPVGEAEEGIAARAQRHLSRLTPNTREALLLHTIEEFGYDEIGAIMDVPEDEAIIAMDIQSIVADMGHRVTGVARTRDGAVELGKEERPDLILADIQLADNSSGIDAVNDLLAHFGNIPVIFITAFPERLLTGEKPEPAFLISKPYTEDQVRSAVSQAMFFASTETLHA